MIKILYIKDDNKTLLTILFNRLVLNHLKCKCDDNLMILQSIYKENYLTMVKSENGSRIRQYPRIRKFFQIVSNHPLNNFCEVECKCSYFFKKNSTVKIIVK